MHYECIIRYMALKTETLNHTSRYLHSYHTYLYYQCNIKHNVKYYPSGVRDVFTLPFKMILCRKCDYQSRLHIIL